MECLALRKELEEAQESWLGEARGTGWCVAGGMREEFPLDGIEAATESIMHILKEWKKLVKKPLASALPSWLSGRISSISWNARAEAWAGPLARAAGLEIDARAEESGPYQMLGWSPAGARRGDAIPAALLEVKVLEVSASLEMVLLFLAELPGGPLIKKRGGRGKGQGFGRVEGPAGEVCCQVKLEKGFIKAAFFSSPDRFNRSILRAFKGAWLDEVEVASFLWG
jgi:Ni,Fe-hydrogenase III large subunit